MHELLKSISISRKTHLLFLLLFSTVISMAQGSYSNQIVTIGEDEFMPYCRGEVRKHFEGESAQMMEKIYRAIASWDSLNPPKGFEARFTGSNHVLDLIFAAYIKQGNSKTVKSGAMLSFYINDPIRVFGFPVVENIFFQPEKVADFYGYPVYQNTNTEVTVIIKSNNSLFVPVTQGEYLQQLIKVETDKQNKSAGNHQKSDSDEILAEMEKAYKELLKTDPSAAAEFKTEIQKFKTEMTNEGTENNADDLLTSLKRELDKLSPAGRNKPAWYSLGAIEKYGNFSGLIPDTVAEEGTALVKIAAEFSGLINEKNALKFLAISWNVGIDNSTSDKPRLLDGEVKGFGLADYYIANLYRQQIIWNKIINLVQ